MRQIEVNTPDNCKAIGFLYDEEDPESRGEDMIDIILPDGVIVTGGWYPEGDPNGRYLLGVHRGLEDVVPPQEFDDIDELASEIERVVSRYARLAGQPISNRACH